MEWGLKGVECVRVHVGLVLRQRAATAARTACAARGEQRRGGSETGSAAPRTFRMWKYSMGRRSASGAGRAEA